MRNRYVLLGDIVLVSFCALAAFALRVDWQFADFANAFEVYLIAAIVLKPVVLLAFGAYSRYWRYGSIREYLGLALGVTATLVPMVAVMFFALVTRVVQPFPRSIFAIDWLLCLVALAAWRVSIRVVLESRDADKTSALVAAKRLLVAGAGEAGVLVVREMQRKRTLGMWPVGFLDDAPAKLGKKIHGVPVLGTCEELVKVVADHRVDEVIVAMPRADGRVVRHIVENCRRAAVASRTIPGVFELLGGQVSVNRLRSIEL